MTNKEQRDRMDEHLLKTGLSPPWEYRIREIAADAVRDPYTYINGYVLTVQKGSGLHNYLDVCIRLIPELQRYPKIAQLIAEQQILEQVPA